MDETMLKIFWSRRSRLPAGMSAALVVLLGCGRAQDTTSVVGPDTSSSGDAATPSTTQADAAPPGTPVLLSDGRRIVDSGKPAPAGECARDADCSEDANLFGAGQCSEFVPGGYRTCTYHPAEATEPSPYANECDATRPCAEGRCYLVTFSPAGLCTAGGGGAADLKRCRADECASDADCAGGICAPRGFRLEANVEGGDVRSCIPAGCRSNTDCNAEPGGVCAVIHHACVESTEHPGRTLRPEQLACVYAGGCTEDADCPIGNCVLSDGRAVCAAANVTDDCSEPMTPGCPTYQSDPAG
jgi:hypothetical protein